MSKFKFFLLATRPQKIPSNSALSPIWSKKILQNNGSEKKIYFKCAFNYNSKLIHHNNNLWKKLERDEQGERGRRKEKEESKRKEKKRKLFTSHFWMPANFRIYCHMLKSWGLLVYSLVLVIHIWQWHQLIGRFCGSECFVSIIASSCLCLLICTKEGHDWLLPEPLVQ